MPASLQKIFVALILTALSLQPAAACAVCYGEPNSPMTRGLTWGILALCAVVGTVLAAVATFFVHVGRRSRELSRVESGEEASS